MEKVSKALVCDWKRADWSGYADCVRTQLQYDWKSMFVTEMDTSFCAIVSSAEEMLCEKEVLASGEWMLGPAHKKCEA